MVTHSPFVLSDMMTQNTLYLKNGQVQKVNAQTFGANYYEMLNKSFFFDKSAIGTIASEVIGNMIQRKNNEEKIGKEELEIVGDNFIRNYLEE